MLAQYKTPIIYLVPASRPESICLPFTTSVKTSRASLPAEADRDIHDISTHKVYPPTWLPRCDVRSYRTISPWPQKPKAYWGGIVSVTLSVSHNSAGPHPLDGAAPYVVRTFLILESKFETAIGQLAALVCKSNIFVTAY